ncbi:MAG: hypothetical protein O3A31_05790 [Planctomycetota bacterium]|jgi:hypothetical protein|nr:hypothetical protein [Planctomycetota bacterium]
MKTPIIGFVGRFRPEACTFLKEAGVICNPRGETSFLLVRHSLETWS